MKKGYWKNKNVFITGCTGILGSWLTIRLVEEGANVIGLVRDLVPKSNLNWSGFHTKINIVRGSVTDYETVLRALNEYEIDTCFHLAAQTIVTIANRSPASTFESNIKGTWVLLEALRQIKTVERIVVASSDKAYGEHKVLPYTEDQPLTGSYPYDVSKSCTDLIAQSYYHYYGLPVGISRCGNIYGGGDLNFNRIVPGAIRSICFEEDPIIRSDGLPQRDYIYVKDVVNSYLLLAARLDDEKIRGEAFNFSHNDPLNVLDLTRLIIECSGKTHLKPKVLGEGNPKGEIERQYLSSKKAKKLLDWKPTYSLEEGLKETIAWYNKFFETREGGKNSI